MKRLKLKIFELLRKKGQKTSKTTVTGKFSNSLEHWYQEHAAWLVYQLHCSQKQPAVFAFKVLSF